MTYKELLEKIAKIQQFDSVYTLNNLTVKECFYNDYILNSEQFLEWSDRADNDSINELIKLEII